MHCIHRLPLTYAAGEAENFNAAFIIDTNRFPILMFAMLTVFRSAKWKKKKRRRKGGSRGRVGVLIDTTNFFSSSYFPVDFAVVISAFLYQYFSFNNYLTISSHNFSFLRVFDILSFIYLLIFFTAVTVVISSIIQLWN